MSFATCRTEGCANAGWSIDTTGMDVDAEGQTIVPWTVACGVCGQVIDDVTDAPYPPPVSEDVPEDVPMGEDDSGEPPVTFS